MLYEISLKFNTLKMYENTIDQMKKNGNDGTESFKKILQEKEQTEKELSKLINPDAEEKKSDNEFIKKAMEKKDYYKNNNFFDSFKFSNEKFNDVAKEYRNGHNANNNDFYLNYKKPSLADIQEKISNSRWVNCSNFIVNFPKDKVNIESWRVSSFDYSFGKRMCRSASDCISGELELSVNDFSYKSESGEYVTLSRIIEDMYKKSYSYILGNISVDVIDNAVGAMYTLLFTGCKFKEANFSSFDYSRTDLRKVLLTFTFEDVKTLTPDETAD